MWRADAATCANSAARSESSGTDPASRAECRGVRPSQHRTHIRADSRGRFHDEFKCREEVWLCRTRTPRNAWRPADQGIDGVPGSLKPVHAPPGDSTGAMRPGHQYSLLAGCSRILPAPVSGEVGESAGCSGYLVSLVRLVQPNKRDKPNKPEQPDKPPPARDIRSDNLASPTSVFSHPTRLRISPNVPKTRTADAARSWLLHFRLDESRASGLVRSDCRR